MKRFYKTVSIFEQNGSFGVKLDQREIKTPLKSLLLVPTKTLADLVVDEWDRQGDEIDLQSMDITKLANTAIDRVIARRGEVEAELLTYAKNDLICYYAEYPEQLVKRQKQLWQPCHEWLMQTFGYSYETTSGLIHVEQPKDLISAYEDYLSTLDGFQLTALHSLTTGLGSFALGLMYISRRIDFDTIWQAALVEELFQEEEWGQDAEALKRRSALCHDMKAVDIFLNSLNLRD